MSELISPLALEKYLNDNKRLLILHALDGEIWGASIAAIELFGYTNDEFKQMYLANIKPKKLRLSDVCKTQKDEDAAVIFERRNGRRFTATANTKILRTTLLKSTVDLVLLDLEVVTSNVVHFPRVPQFNIQEASDYVQAFCQELISPVADIKSLLNELRSTELTEEQSSVVEKICGHQENIAFVSDNLTDSMKLALNMLNLERQPFNIIDMIGQYALKWSNENRGVSVCVDRSVPELVYGDENRLGKIWLNLVNRCSRELKPQHIKMEVQSRNTEKNPDDVSFTITLENCEAALADDDAKIEHTKDNSLLNKFSDSSAIYISKNLIRMMDGSIKFVKTTESSYEITFRVGLPEVHDLGLKGNRRFLNNFNIMLVDNTNSLLRQQLTSWGAQVEHFRAVGAAIDYLETQAQQENTLVVVHFWDDKDLEIDLLDKLTNHGDNRTLLIKPKEYEVNVGRVLFQIPTPYQPSMLGNVLSQFVHEQFPFPYSNSHKKRSNEEILGNKRVLVVDDSEDTRLIVHKILTSEDYKVDVAVNGIDAVLACAHNQYDIILMDIHLPYMDGFEAVTHLRKVSELNTRTRIVVISSDTGENARLMMEQVGVKTMIKKPIDTERLLLTLTSFDTEKSDGEGSEGDELTNQGRRAYEHVEDNKKYETPVNEEIIQRLENDTNSDICREMVDMFIEESLIALGEVEKSCMAGDWDSVANHAHSICSSSMTFGCEALHDLAQQLKNESQKNNLGECMRLAAKLPEVFLMSQQSLYNICNRNISGN